jgi:hypothetical protein
VAKARAGTSCFITGSAVRAPASSSFKGLRLMLARRASCARCGQ